MRARVAILGAVMAASLAVGVTAVQGDLVAAFPASLAYVTGGTEQVWLANADGTKPVRLGPGNQPLLSLDSSQVAASVFPNKGNALVIYNPGTTITHKYFDIKKVSATALSWSPESQYLAVALSNVNGNGGSLAIINTMTNSVKTIATGSVCGASFAPQAPDRLVYGLGSAKSLCTKSDIYTVAANGSGRTQITHGGHSLNPVWGAGSIAFDREKLRKLSPIYQIWLMKPDGTGAIQLTHTNVPSLLLGLIPRQFSARGDRLLAEYAGQDTDETWTIDLPTRKARHLVVRKLDVTPGGLSLDGKTVLIDYGGFANPPSAGTIETIPFAGGPAKVLVKHANEPSWNR